MTKRTAGKMTTAEFRAWRKRCGLTQAQAAERLGCSRSTVLRWEGGMSVPIMAAAACRQIEEVDIPGERKTFVIAVLMGMLGHG